MNLDRRLIGQEVEILTREGLIFLGVLVEIEPDAFIIERMVGENPMEMVRVRSIVADSQTIAIRVREMVMPPK